VLSIVRRPALRFHFLAAALLVLMALLAGGSALRESTVMDEAAHIGAGVSYLQKFDLRLNGEHPPLPKMLAAIPLVLRGTYADYSSPQWKASRTFFAGYMGQWIFGEWLITKWNEPWSTLALARLPMLLLTLALGWVVYTLARRIGGAWAGLLCLSLYVTTPLFLVFGPLVLTDIPITFCSLLTFWTLAELWREPNRRNTLLFAAALTGALLSKFSAGILFFVFFAFMLGTRWRPVVGQPSDRMEARLWRRARRRALWKGIFWAACGVYAFYFVFSLNQPIVVPWFDNHGLAALLAGRLLMPPWLFLRGLGMVLLSSPRPTYILGQHYTHGVWFFFPVLFALKSALGFLALLLVGLVAFIARRKGGPLIPDRYRIHWRVLWVALLVFVALCLASPLDTSIRHFSIPQVLLILMLAPLPLMLARKPVALGLVVLLAGSCLFEMVRQYPYYFPYLNALTFGRPAYVVISDSNLDWNQGLREVQRFAELHGLKDVPIDPFAFSDPTPFVPHARVWDCQAPAPTDAGAWAVVSIDMIRDQHNCEWLLKYPHEALAGGSMYAVQLPAPIPEAGTADGPPLPANHRVLFSAGFDMRTFFLDASHHPETLQEKVDGMMAKFREQMEERKHRPAGNAR